MRGARGGRGEQAKGRWGGSVRIPCLGSKINKYGRVGKCEWLSGEVSGEQAVGAWGARVSPPGCALPPAPMLALPHLLGMAGNTNLPPPLPAQPGPVRAADSIESCRNRSPCPGSIQGNINYPKTKTRGVHSWGPTLQIPPPSVPPSVPPSLLPCCSSSLCTPAIHTVSPPK